jgi:hypothetical protein
MTRILRGLTGKRLDCGCVLGVYETYDGRVITVLDERGRACEAGHEDLVPPPDQTPDNTHKPASA